MSDIETVAAAALNKTPVLPPAHVGRLQFSLMLPLRIDRDRTRHGAAGEHLKRLLQGSPWLRMTPSSWQKEDAPHATVLGTKQAEQHHYQSLLYFHPFMQRLLYGGEDIVRYVRTDITRMRVGEQVRKEGTVESSVVVAEFSISRCELVFVEPDAGVLIVDARLEKDDDPFATGANAARTDFSMARVQTLLDSVRRVYAPYYCANEVTGGMKGGHCPTWVEFSGPGGVIAKGQYCDFDRSFSALPKSSDEVGLAHPMAEHWQALLHPLVQCPSNDDEARFVQLGDDRAFVHALVAVRNAKEFSAPSSPRRGDMIRLALVDDPGANVLPYSRASLENFEREHCYDRFWFEGKNADSDYSPSRIMMTNYSFIFLGDADEKGFFLNENDGAVATFLHRYRPLVMVAVLQRAMLLNASWRLANLIEMKAGVPQSPAPEVVDLFYRHFLRFTQKMWFFEVTPQEQGQKLFAEMQRHLRSKELYEEVRQELHDMVEHSTLAQSAEQTRVTTTFTKLAGVLGAAGLVVGVLSVVIGILSAVVGVLGLNTRDAWWVHAPSVAISTQAVGDFLVGLPRLYHVAAAASVVGIAALAVLLVWFSFRSGKRSRQVLKGWRA